MARTRIHGEDAAGVALAIAAHVALVAWLVWMPQAKPPPLPERVTVTLAGDIGEQASAPSREAAAAAVAPVLAKDPLPVPAPAVVPRPLPMPMPKALPQPAARVLQPPLPKPQLRPAPTPAPLAKREPPKAQVPPKAQTPKLQTRVGGDFLSDAPKSQQAAPPRPGGASRLGDDFLKGVPGAETRGKATTPAAAAISPQAKASIAAEIYRQLRPHWNAPQGAEAEKLITVVRFQLAEDGTLVGQPVVVRQDGVTDANAAQKARHAELAVRAVRLSAPFKLPAQFFASWQVVTSRFDRSLD